jgi:hypothetical protein
MLPTPVRVPSEAIGGIKAEVADISGPILLLGMTPGLLGARARLRRVGASATVAIREVMRLALPVRSVQV